LPLRKFSEYLNTKSSSTPMETKLQQINDTHRIWVYQSSRPLNEQEQEMIVKTGTEFLAQWTAHGDQLYATVSVLYNHFIIIALDEEKAAPGGCSIDKLLHWVMSVERSLHIDLLDRQAIAIFDASQNTRVFTPEQFEQAIAENSIREDVLVFNNLVATGKELKQNWIIPASTSWQHRYFENA